MCIHRLGVCSSRIDPVPFSAIQSKAYMWHQGGSVKWQFPAREMDLQYTTRLKPELWCLSSHMIWHNAGRPTVCQTKCYVCRREVSARRTLSVTPCGLRVTSVSWSLWRQMWRERGKCRSSVSRKSPSGGGLLMPWIGMMPWKRDVILRVYVPTCFLYSFTLAYMW